MISLAFWVLAGNIESAAAQVSYSRNLLADPSIRWPGDPDRYFADDGYHIVWAPSESPRLATTTPQGGPRASDLSLEAEIELLDGPRDRGFGIVVRADEPSTHAYGLLADLWTAVCLDKARHWSR